MISASRLVLFDEDHFESTCRMNQRLIRRVNLKNRNAKAAVKINESTVTQPPRYEHRWKVNKLMIWLNVGPKCAFMISVYSSCIPRRIHSSSYTLPDIHSSIRALVSVLAFWSSLLETLSVSSAIGNHYLQNECESETCSKDEANYCETGITPDRERRPNIHQH